MAKTLRKILLGAIMLGLLAGCNNGGGGGNTPGPDDGGGQGGGGGEGEGGGSHDHDGPLNILFLGNSLIFVNDMPSVFNNICLYQGKDVYVDSVTEGSSTMCLFASETYHLGVEFRAKLAERQWDYIMIEPSRRATPYETTIREAELNAAEVLHGLITANGAETLIYSTWGLQKGETGVYQQVGEGSTKIGTHAIDRQTHCRYLAEFSQAVAERIGGGKIVQAGYAFENMISLDPSVNLYGTDLQHPSIAGTYLVACTVYDTIFQEEVSGCEWTNNLSKALTLQAVADATAIDKEYPDLPYNPGEFTPPTPPEEGENGTQKVLFIGTDIMDDHQLAPRYGELLMDSDKKALQYRECLGGSTSFTQLNTKGSKTNDLMNAYLAEDQWDAIVLQISRRCTPTSADVEKAEHDALEALMTTFKAETENVTLFTLNGGDNPAKFTVDTNGDLVKAGINESCSADQFSDYLDGLCTTWGEEFGCKTARWGKLFRRFVTRSKTDPTIGFEQALSTYIAINEQDVSKDFTWTSGMTDKTLMADIHAAALELCLPLDLLINIKRTRIVFAGPFLFYFYSDKEARQFFSRTYVVSG